MKLDYDALMVKAQKTNRDRDASDRTSGNGAPADHGMRALFNTAITAIEAGIKRANWDAVAEGLVMLHEVQDKTLILGSLDIKHDPPKGKA